MRELGASDKYFYYTASGRNATMDIRMTLKFRVPVNHEALLAATDDALRLFPEYSVRTVLKNGILFYEENHSPVALLKSGTIYDFGSDDMNGYLFCFQLNPSDEREVVFSAYHGLSDWNGVSRLLKTIICRYAVRVKGLPDDAFSSVIRTQPPAESEWRTQANLDPYEFYADKDMVPTYKPAVSGEVFVSNEDALNLNRSGSRHYQVTLSVSQFIKAAKSCSTSFVPYLMYIFSHSVRETYKTDKNILIMFPVDLRNVFKADTIVNFSDSVLLPSSLQEHSAPVEEQCRRFRENINLSRQPENYARFLYDKVQALKSYESAPEGIVAKSRELTTQTSEIIKGFSCGISYPGILDMPEGADDLLDNVIMDAPFGLSYILVTTYRDEMRITSVQRFDEDYLARAIRDKLISTGLEARIDDRGTIEHNILNIERLKKVL